MKSKFHRLAAVLLLVSFFPVCGKDIIMSQGGKCRYSLVVPQKDFSDYEKAAIADLQHYIRKICGGELKIDPSANNLRIFFGRKAPGDKRDYSRNQRSVSVFGNDIYLFGAGRDGNAFAVYDFLEWLGCRWWTAWGRETVPVCRTWQYSFPAPSLYQTPAFLSTEIGSYASALKIFEKQAVNLPQDFLRRNRAYSSGQAYKIIGHFCHTFAVFVPPTGIPAPYPLCWPVEPLKNRQYFKTNPEFFSMNKKGERVNNWQLCFSNPELRKTLTANIEQVIAWNHLENEYIVIPIDANDTPGFCYCPGCLKLAEKYQTESGAFYDYLLETAPYFKKKYPKSKIRFLSGYGSKVAKLPSGKKLSDNVYPFHAFLGKKDYTKPVTAPQNRLFADSIRAFSKLTPNLWVYCYYDLWAIPSDYYHLFPGVLRIAEEIRYYRNQGAEIMFLSAADSSSGQIFRDMKNWILLQLVRNPALDPEALAAEYINANYGAAAPLVFQFWSELEQAERYVKNPVCWDSSHLLDRDITGRMMMHWNRLFDRMEEKVRHDPEAMDAVSALRWVLDYNIVSRWNDFIADNPAEKARLAFYHSRCKAEILRNFGAKFLHCNRKNYGTLQWGLVRALDEYAAVHYPAKHALPGILAKTDPALIRQVLPYHSRSRRLVRDPQAAFGIAAEGLPHRRPFQFGLKIRGRFFDEKNARCFSEFKSLTMDDLKNAAPGYQLYHIGVTELTPDCEITDFCSPKNVYTSATVGQFHDPEKPDIRWDVYASMKYLNDKVYTDRVILVRRKQQEIISRENHFPAR